MSEGTAKPDVETGLDRDIGFIVATREGNLRKLVFGAVPDAVGERAQNTIIMAMRYQCITSRIRQWLRWG